MVEKRKLLPNGNVEIISITEVPRYIPRVFGETISFHDSLLEDMLENYAISSNYSKYKKLNTFDFTSEKSIVESLDDYQKALDKQYGPIYEAFVLGVYVHSGTSFSISKTGDNRCKWDSSNIGLIGIPKDWANNVNSIAKELTDIWEGNFCEYQVYDNLNEEIVDTVSINDSTHPYVIDMEKKYKVSFKDLYPVYND